MADRLIRKLEQFTRLSREDKKLLEIASGAKVRSYTAREELVQEGEKSGEGFLFLSGWACRTTTLPDGRRQITALFLPGDIYDLDKPTNQKADHCVVTLTGVEIAILPKEFLLEILREHPRLNAALRWESNVNASTQREWTVNLGQRTAQERIAHLLCEIYLRLQSVGLTQDKNCDFPITQSDLGDTVGLSTVHVNRVIQDLRSSGLIVLEGKRLTINDLESLMGVALFSDAYLHRNREGRHLDANEP